MSRPPLRAAITRLHAAADGASQIDLGRLDAASSAALVAEITSAASPATQARIVEAAAGNPLFLVEMARHGDHHGDTAAALAASGASGDRRPARPAVRARRRAGGRRGGRRSVVHHRPRRPVARRADRRHRRRRAAGDAASSASAGCDGYDFTHDRIRDVAYRRVGPARRRRLHGEVAAALRELGGEPAQIAYHCERAGQVDCRDQPPIGGRSTPRCGRSPTRT